SPGLFILGQLHQGASRSRDEFGQPLFQHLQALERGISGTISTARGSSTLPLFRLAASSVTPRAAHVVGPSSKRRPSDVEVRPRFHSAALGAYNLTLFARSSDLPSP